MKFRVGDNVTIIATGEIGEIIRHQYTNVDFYMVRLKHCFDYTFESWVKSDMWFEPKYLCKKCKKCKTCKDRLICITN